MNLPKPAKGILQLIFLIVIAIAAWKAIHRAPTIDPEVYPYLSKISPEIFKQCVADKRQAPQVAWEHLLAIHSSLSNNEAQNLVQQLCQQVAFADLDWGLIPTSKQTTVRHRVEILRHYPFYQPNKYRFPVLGTAWFEDSFGAEREGGKRRHEGADLFGQEGIPIVSSSGGTIEQLGWNRLGGERVGVRGDDGNYYYYAHLQAIEPSLNNGQRIEAGTIIGSLGHSGDALTTPDHLHFGIELPNGEWVNPYPFLKIWQLWPQI